MSACSCVTDGVGDEARVFGGAGISSADATSELPYKGVICEKHYEIKMNDQFTTTTAI